MVQGLSEHALKLLVRIGEWASRKQEERFLREYDGPVSPMLEAMLRSAAQAEPIDASSSETVRLRLVDGGYVAEEPE